MTGTDWLLSLHILSAVFLGAAMTGFWAMVLAVRSAAGTISLNTGARLGMPLTVAVSVGTLGTLVFGVWLAIVEERYQVWDGWILAAIVLWAIGTELGRRSGKLFATGEPADRSRGILLHSASSVAVVLVLILMIWKPGS